MNAARNKLILLNVVGGIAVLASYAYLAWVPSEVRQGLWGGLPESFKGPYTFTMLAAAAGYFPLTYELLFRTDLENEQCFGRPAAAVLFALYALVLIPSAAWLPLTVAMLTDPSAGLWTAIRIVLALVGVGTAGLLWLSVDRARRTRGLSAWLAAVGAAFFFLQTAVLDALVWPAWFPL